MLKDLVPPKILCPFLLVFMYTVKMWLYKPFRNLLTCSNTPSVIIPNLILDSTYMLHNHAN